MPRCFSAAFVATFCVAFFTSATAYAVITPAIAVIAPSSGSSLVSVYNADGTARFSFFAYDPGYTGGVSIAVGDVTGDGFADIVTGTSDGFQSNVNVFDGVTGGLARSFLAFDSSFTGGVSVAVGDTSGDGRADIIVGAGVNGHSHVRAFDGISNNVFSDFFAYGAGFAGSINVAVGNIDGGSSEEIVTGTGAGSSANVKVFNGSGGSTLASFFAFDSAFTGGVNVAAGDTDGDGLAEIVAGAGIGGGPNVKVFDGLTGIVERNFFAYASSFQNGVRVGVGDMDGDNRGDIITSEFGVRNAATPLQVFSGANPGDSPTGLPMPYDYATLTVGGGMIRAFPVVVPESGSVGLLATGLTLLGMMTRAFRRRR